ncbi:MAG: hypothetical protein LBE91_01300, partial [Tannerella sp.]|nr:hypothetical protein [Tannerella sp.]
IGTGNWFTTQYAGFYTVFIFLSINIFHIKKWQSDKIGTRFVILITLWLFLQLVFRGNVYGTYIIYAVLTCRLLYFVFTSLFYYDKELIKWSLYAILLTAGIESVYGFGQLFGLIPNNNTVFQLGGSFGTPSAYASYLAVISPIVLYLLLSYKRIRKAENFYYAVLTGFVFILSLLILSKSRAAWIASSAGCLMVLNHRYLLLKKFLNLLKTPFRKVTAIMLSVILTVVGSVFLYQFKSDSAFGRLLIWKVIYHNAPSDNFLLGNGTGYFEAGYGKWQAAYFEKSGGTEKERYVADYVTCAYNELIEMLLEQGFLFTLILAAFLIYLYLKRFSRQISLLTCSAFASLTAVIILSFFSFPLKIIPVYLTMTFCITLILRDKKQCMKINLFVKYCFIIGCIYIFGLAVFNLYGYSRLHEGQRQVFTGGINTGISTYEKALPSLKNNGFFRFYYGSALAQTGKTEESIEQLQLSIEKSSNPNSYLLLGQSFQKLKKYSEAETAYKTVIHMIPYKLYPKYLLTRLYMEKGDTVNAKNQAIEILETQEKVPTTAAKEIKDEMKKYLQEYENR